MHDQGNRKSPEILQLPYERNLIHVFLNLTTVLKIYDLIYNELWSWEETFLNDQQFKKKIFWSTVLEKRPNALIFSKENDTTKSMSYEEVILKAYSQNLGIKKKFYGCVSGNKYKYYYFSRYCLGSISLFKNIHLFGCTGS